MDTERHNDVHLPDPNAYDAGFYAKSNPKFLGLPLGVLLAAGVAVIAICITLAKFLGLPPLLH